MCPGGSTRWCPTPEQVMILEEMYRSGIRTPNATQIQQITSQLSFYGKIEGKNVFYWFQNHKARERQKLRKKLTKQLHLQRQQHQLYHQLQQNHHFLHHVDSPASPGFQHLSYYNSASLFPQAGIYEDPSAAAEAAKQLMNHTWKFDSIPEKVEKNEAMMRRYGSDWLMMVDLGPPLSSSPPYCCCSSATTRPPLKTLQLFPVTASNLKEECCNNKINNCSKPPPCNIDANPTLAKVPLTLP